MHYQDLIATPVLLAFLAALVRADLARQRLPDALTLPLVALGLVLSVLTPALDPAAALIGVVAGYGVFWAVGEAFFALRGRDGLGLGDAKLFAAAGAWLGWAALPAVLLVATLGALGYILVTGRDHARPLPFGPWLAAGFVALWLVRLMSGGFHLR